MLGFYIHGILQNPFKDPRRSGDDHRNEGEENAHENSTCAIVGIAGRPGTPHPGRSAKPEGAIVTPSDKDDRGGGRERAPANDDPSMKAQAATPLIKCGPSAARAFAAPTAI